MTRSIWKVSSSRPSTHRIGQKFTNHWVRGPESFPDTLYLDPSRNDLDKLPCPPLSPSTLFSIHEKLGPTRCVRFETKHFRELARISPPTSFENNALCSINNLKLSSAYFLGINEGWKKGVEEERKTKTKYSHAYAPFPPWRRRKK